MPLKKGSRLVLPQGTHDEVIDISSGQKLASLIKPKYRFPPLWAEVVQAAIPSHFLHTMVTDIV